jgi:phosphatidylglycerophosphate synthase
MIEMWSLPALAVALLVAIIVQFRGSLVWWKVLLVAALISISECFLVAIQRGGLYDASFFVAKGLVLFIGAQLSLLICRKVGRFPT